jgi:ribosomal protein S18 acetylase RimI-like enzyme
MKEQLQVIPSTLFHYYDILKIYNDAFLPKFRFVTHDNNKQKSFVDDFSLIDLDTTDKEFVAVVNGQVVGILSLRFFEQKINKHSPNLSYWRLFQKYGFRGVIKALLFDLSFKYHPPKDELYIDSLGVATDSRGLGAGTHLLDFAEDFAKQNGLKKLSLLVMYENQRAKALYERSGYSVKSSRSLWWLKRTTGYSRAYFMVRNL